MAQAFKVGDKVTVQLQGRPYHHKDGTVTPGGTRTVLARITKVDAFNAEYEVIESISADGDQGDVGSAYKGGFAIKFAAFCGVKLA